MRDRPIEGGWIKKCYWGIVKSENFLGSFLLLSIRLYWGILLVMTGLGKWGNIDGVASFFDSINIPFPLFTAYFVGLIEFLGGISLVLGLFSRIFSVFLVVTFIVAYLTAHSEALINFFINPQMFIDEQPFLYMYASLVVMCFGPGFFSFDWWIERKAYGKAL